MKKFILLIFLILPININCAVTKINKLSDKQQALVNAIKNNDVDLVELLCLEGVECHNANELTTNPVILNIIINTGADQCNSYSYDKFSASILGSLPESDPTISKKLAMSLSDPHYKKRLVSLSSFIKSTGIFTLDEWDILLSFGININKQDNNHKTALVYLSETENNEDLISRLIDLGAKLFFDNNKSAINSIKCMYKIINMHKIDKKTKLIFSMEFVNNSEYIDKLMENAPIDIQLLIQQIVMYTQQHKFSEDILNLMKNLAIQTGSILK